MPTTPSLLTADAAFLADPALVPIATVLVAAASAGNWYAATIYPDTGHLRIIPGPAGPIRSQLWARLEEPSGPGPRRCWTARLPQGGPAPAPEAPEWIQAPDKVAAVVCRLLTSTLASPLHLSQNRLDPETYRVDLPDATAPLTAQFSTAEVSP